MAGNGDHRNAAADDSVLRWAGRVLAAEDLRRSLNGHREIVLPPRAIVTPLALEELRACGVTLKRQQPVEPETTAAARWGYAQDRPHSGVAGAVQALRREGLELHDLAAASRERQRPEQASPAAASGRSHPRLADEIGAWARAVADCVARGDCQGGVVFCQDPGLVCCIANKVAGLRAVPVATVAQAARATLGLGANLLAVEMPGRTFFEVRQIVRTLCAPGRPACPPGVACTLEDLDGHAHR